MAEFRYTNPISLGREHSMRDHQIIKVDGAWYLTGTSHPVWGGPNPGVKQYVSRDLLHWEFVGFLIDASKLPADCFYNGRFWAPEIHHARGKFWLTVNSGNGLNGDPRRMNAHAIVLFVANHVTGPYTLVTTERPIGKPFKNDASLFTDDDGRSYLYCSGGGLWQSEIDLPRGRLIGGDDLTRIVSPKDAGLPDWMIGGIEGPFVVKRGGLYHMLFSAWTRGYEIGLMRAPTPLGPWQLATREPIMGTRKRRYREEQMRQGGYAHLVFTDTDDPFVETGHCALFEGPDGRDWLSCHYFPQGLQPISCEQPGMVEYEDTEPQLGIEPIDIEAARLPGGGPTFTPQVVKF